MTFGHVNCQVVKNDMMDSLANSGVDRWDVSEFIYAIDGGFGCLGFFFPPCKPTYIF